MKKPQTKWSEDLVLDKRKHFGYLVHDLARQLRRQFDAEAQSHDLTMPQWRVIAQLSLGDGISQVGLSGLCETDPMTMSGVIERLESKGLVQRVSDPDDSRAKIVLITDKARGLVGQMKALAEQVYTAAFEGISEADKACAMNVLSQMSDNLSRQRAPGREELV